MIDLIEKNKGDKDIVEGIKKLNLIDYHPDFKIGDIISFYGGYNGDILYKSEIVGFDGNRSIYVLWDCYWSPIRDEEKRKITKL